jgi:hypothetical protein
MGPKDIIDSTLSVVEKYSTWRQLKKDTGAILRLLYLESKRNSNLLSSIKYENKIRNTKNQESEFNGIITALEIEILELIFMAGKSNSKVFEFMKNPSEFDIDDDENFINETPLNALSFLYVKIWALKKLITMNQSSVLKKINYKVRLKNIQSAYISLMINLEKVPEVKILNR